MIVPAPPFIAHSVVREPIELSFEDLRASVGSVVSGLRCLGVRAGDRVAAYLPNVPEAVVLMAASSALGAVYWSCPPEFGVKAVLDRFRQMEPTVLVAVDSYPHKGISIDRSSEVAAIRAGLPSCRRRSPSGIWVSSRRRAR